MSSVTSHVPVGRNGAKSQQPCRNNKNVGEILLINMVIALATLLVTISSAGSLLAANAGPKNLQLATNLTRPNDLNSGGLLFPSNRNGYYVQAPRLETNVTIDVNGPIARTKVTQRFENPSKGWVEGLYVFPLPEDSAVDTLKMQIGNRLIEGKIKPRAEAKKIYQQAKREGKKAALLEQQRPNIFTNTVANIGPGESVIIQIEYQQTIRQDQSIFSLRFPMVVVPRYNPKPIIQSVNFSNNQEKKGWGVVDPVPDREEITSAVLDPQQNAKINPVTLTVKLAAGFPLETVKSHHHRIKQTVIDDATQLITLESGHVPADQDFELNWTAKGTAPTAALFHERVGEDEFVLAFITPPKLTPVQLSQLEKKNREVIFVIDNSGSMGGESIVQARESLANALQRLAPDDRFNIVRFNDSHEVLFPQSVRADREHLDQALTFVRTLEANGGTEMLNALNAALLDKISGGTVLKQQVRQVIFITDGAIGNEQQLFDVIGTQRGRSRIFTIGIGSAPNSFFMRRAAEIGRGTFTHIGSTGQVAERMNSLFLKLENPVLTGLRAVVSGGNLSEVTPDPLPDLYLGEPIVLSAKTKGLTGALTISGDYAGTPWEVTMQLAQATLGTGVGKLWARRKIGSLEAEKSMSQSDETMDKEIEATALTHHLVSRLTSLVAVDVTNSRPSNEDLTRKEIPHNLPKGWEFEKVFGDQGTGLQRKAALQTRSLQVAALMAPAPTKVAAAEIAQKNRAVVLPQTATQADRNMILGLLIMLLAGLIWMTSRMWSNTAIRIRDTKPAGPPLHLLD